MKRRTTTATTIAAALALFAMTSLAAAAIPVRADSGYAALLIVFGPDDYYSECIPLSGQMSSLDLLWASAVEVTIESDAATADSVCSIDSTGCAYPDEDCYCQCNQEACSYWAQYYMASGGWQSAFDPESRLLESGDLDAWVWGDGLSEPPIASFADVCPGVALPEDSDPESDDAYPAPPTTPADDHASSYPGPATMASTRAPAATETRRPFTVTPEAPAIPQPLEQITPTATPWRVYRTPTVLEPLTTKATITATSTEPMMEEQPPAEVDAAPVGTPTPDQVAILLNTSAARVRATRLATRSEQPPERWGLARMTLIAIAVAAAAYLGLLWRQRHLDRGQHEARPQNPDTVSADETDHDAL